MEHTTSFKGMNILTLTVGYFNFLETCDLLLEKLPLEYSSPESQFFTDSNKSPIIWKIQNRLWTSLLGPGEFVS
jgi:hypothetical protein